MRSNRALVLRVLLTLGILAAIPFNAYAVTCDVTAVTWDCEGSCLVLYFAATTNCSGGATVKLERRESPSGSWVLLSTSATSPYTDCGIIQDVSYDYRFTVTCSPCGATKVRIASGARCPL